MIHDSPSRCSFTERLDKVSAMKLRLGPLRYLMQAHDNWGKETLALLRGNIECLEFDGPPGRTIHLLEFQLSLQERKEVDSDYLPDRLSKIIPGLHPKRGWKLTSDQAGNVTWHCSGCSHSLWTWNTETPHFKTVFQLPWYPMLEDMVKLGGALVHSGLAVVEERGYLFTAPPGGGKTTTLSRIPPPWQVVADDAVLVWPTGAGVFRAAPLPTWGVLFGSKERIQNVLLWKVGATFEIDGVILLKKEDNEKMMRLRPSEAARHLYRAFSEHPVAVTNRHPFRKDLFRTACCLSRAIPSWQLELSLEGAFGELLRKAVLDEQ
jgi:SynChlorMet cassette protein ScmC